MEGHLHKENGLNVKAQQQTYRNAGNRRHGEPEETVQRHSRKKIVKPRKTEEGHLGNTKDKPRKDKEKHLVPNKIATSLNEKDNSHLRRQRGVKLSHLHDGHPQSDAVVNSQLVADI